ncbi:MAG TPA: magnesium chelatase ATPase subunit I [Pyrinomonadaceae bacterium]|nr:magnesium chelatase ATPase subunit I [Pyrinomonadaceae bacterium]
MSKKHNARDHSRGARLRKRSAKPPVYPFSAIVGQAEMKLALLLNAIDPSIGGVLIMGHRGTGKSTAVRALADLLPRITRARDCFYGCDPAGEANLCDDCLARLDANGKLASESCDVPVVDLPLGATEDRVCGTINIERALKEGVRSFEPGLLARANRGFIYIDEVNLLEDHLIDLLLDVAVTGRNIVEREGVSVEHPARFVLVGSGNPEEGDLRPQLLDRFGLHAEVKTVTDLDERVSIVELHEAFERDPEGFRALMKSEQESLRRRLTRARKNLQAVNLPRELLRRIAELCQQLKIDGHRGEITIARAARSLAAFEGRRVVSESDVRRVATLALRHRLRRDPLEQSPGGARIQQQLDKLFPQEPAGEEKGVPKEGRAGVSTSAPDDHEDGAGRSFHREAEGREAGKSQPAPPPQDANLRKDAFDSLPQTRPKMSAAQQSKRQRAHLHRSSYSTRGRYVRATATRTPEARIALDATLRAALGSRQWAEGRRQKAEGSKQKTEGGSESSLPAAHCLLPTDLRYKRFKRRAGTLFIFAVDTSGSMALNRIAQAKGALVRLLQRSYIKRDRVALLTFRGEGAELLLQPSGSIVRARSLLNELSVGGATPLAAGLVSALEVAARAKRQGAQRVALLLFTDGRANVPLNARAVSDNTARRLMVAEELKTLGAAVRQSGLSSFIIDTQNRFTASGEGERLAEVLGARYLPLEARGDL